ncbi:MAG TPA: hypothetical protein VMU83_13870 [Hanamia sp.]|nr:hypothetical protein [Hanamia sp.]
MAGYISLEMVLKLLSTNFSLLPSATDGEILTQIKNLYPELVKESLINKYGSDLIKVLETLVKGGYVKIHDGVPARYSITNLGEELNNQYIQLESSEVGLFDDKEIINAAEWYIDTQGKSNITWLVYTHFKVLRDNNNRADNIATQMEQTDKFVIYFLPNDPHNILVKKNPNYELNENIKATNISVQNLNDKLKTFNKWTVIIAALTGIFIAGQFVLLLILSPKDSYKQIEKIVRSQESLKQSLQGIDSSISRVLEDSLYAPFHHQK